MNNSLIEKIIPELCEALVGLAFREVVQIADSQYVLVFQGEEFRLLFISFEAREPRIYLIKRRLRDLKKQRVSPSKFAVDLTKGLAGSTLISVEKQKGERLVELRFATDTTFIAQLTGKSANLFLLDSDRVIVGAARKPGSEDQSLGKTYSWPSRSDDNKKHFEGTEIAIEGDSISEALDLYFEERKAAAEFEELAAETRRKQRNLIIKLQKLIRNLEADRAHHGDAEKWKRYGDLLLANASNARRSGKTVFVNDLFEASEPEVEIEVDKNDSISEAAQKYFRRYTKSRNAVTEMESRIEAARKEIETAEDRLRKIDEAIIREDATFLKQFLGKTDKNKSVERVKKLSRLPAGIRSFVSSDGLEILVGKKATDNDVLTFKIANSRDLWMHAADYPGSHVVIRNPDKKDVPHKSLIEAAQLAAFYSQGKKQTKAAVRYTEKKFVNKPKGAAPGLVRLASFKTLLVEPVFPNVMPK